MIPTSPVIPGFEKEEVVFAKDQPEYVPLPAIRCSDGEVISRWRLGWRERLKILWTGSLYLRQLTFGQKLQPQLPTVDCPTLVRQ